MFARGMQKYQIPHLVTYRPVDLYFSRIIRAENLALERIRQRSSVRWCKCLFIVSSI